MQDGMAMPGVSVDRLKGMPAAGRGTGIRTSSKNGVAKWT
jgi:hypothetical protein